MIEDQWMHFNEALKILGSEWNKIGNKLVKKNQYDVVIQSIRIYNGDEHELSRKDHIITNLTNTAPLFDLKRG